MKNTLIALSILVCAVTVGTGIWFCFKLSRVAPAAASPVKKKEYSKLIAEGVRYRDFANVGVDRFAFKNCHVEKRRKGALTLGAFNILVVDELVLNMPSAVQTSKASQGSLLNNIKESGFAETFLHSQGYAPGRFSGLRINGLSVNCICSNSIRRIFSAERAESDMQTKGLKLRACTVFSADGNERHVTSAQWVLAPGPTLIYHDGGTEHRIPCE